MGVMSRRDIGVLFVQLDHDITTILRNLFRIYIIEMADSGRFWASKASDQLANTRAGNNFCHITNLGEKMEARVGIEPALTDLQSAA